MSRDKICAAMQLFSQNVKIDLGRLRRIDLQQIFVTVARVDLEFPPQFSQDVTSLHLLVTLVIHSAEIKEQDVIKLIRHITCKGETHSNSIMPFSPN